MVGPSVGERLAQIKSRIAAACVANGRAADAAGLIAVSKLHELALLREAWAAGQRDFGENYANEAAAKIDAWGPHPPRWHFIGRLQSNKVRHVANRFAFIHSIDRLDIAERLDRATVDRQNIFIQFNVADEASKGGAGRDAVTELVARVNETCPRLTIEGLMVMPPLTDDPAASRPYFREARATLESLAKMIPGQPLNQLSMGTSADFEAAIAEGATWVRIGTDVFGPRTKG